MPDPGRIEEVVKEHYATAARQAAACCSVPDSFGPDGAEVYGAARYDLAALADLPAEAVAASIGCANPVALAELHPGEIVLDLGSGGGVDVLLSARRVGPTGHAYGVDMTDEMLDLARANQQRAAITNAEFLHGHIEAVPLPDQTVDVVMSNCVINLSADKPAVFRESFRLLRPGGRLAVADVVAEGHVEDALRDDLGAWADCLGGAVIRDEYRTWLTAAGFVDVTIQDSHPVAEGFTSVLIRAVKPTVGIGER